MRQAWISAIAVLAAPGVTCLNSSALASCKIDQVAAFSVAMDGGVPVASGEINGLPVRLAVNSDAFTSVVRPEIASKLRLSRYAIWSFDISESGRTVPGYHTYVDRLKLFGPMPWVMDDRVDGRNGTSFIIAAGLTRFDGIIGQNVLGLRDVEYDLARGIVRSSSPVDCLEETPAYWAEGQPVMSLPLQRIAHVNRHTVATVVVNGVKLHASFSTSALSTTISSKAARKVGITPVGGDGRANVDLGIERLPDARLMVVDYGNGYRDNEVDMRIGLDFFLTHRVYVANDMRRIYFTYSGGRVFGVTPAIRVPVNAR